MNSIMAFGLIVFLSVSALAITPVAADTFTFSTGSPDGRMGTASRPDSPGKIKIESADDFVTTSTTRINQATFTGLLTGGAGLANISQVNVEMYRVFPNDSNTARTSGPPTFSSAQVPTRVNSPSDIAFETRGSVTGNLTFTTTLLNNSFTVANTVVNGIHPLPNILTGGEGPTTGLEVHFAVTFTTPFSLPSDHYFFVPQVQVTGGEFLWLSAPKPITTGTPFTPDLQSWIRNASLDPDWLRIGTDIVGGTPAPTFNAAFSLSGETIPEPSTLLLLASGVTSLAGWSAWRRMKTRRSASCRWL